MAFMNTPQVQEYRTPVRAADPRAIWIAQALGRLFGRGVNGRTGTLRYGYPALGTRNKFLGYVNPPQLFTGYDPRKVARGSFRGAPGSLPTTSSPGSLSNPLQAAMATVTTEQLAGQA